MKTDILAKHREPIVRMAPLHWKKTPIRQLTKKVVTFEDGTPESQKEALAPGILKLILLALAGTAVFIGLLLYWLL